VVFHVRAALWLCFVFGGVGIFSGYLSDRIAAGWMWVAEGLGKVSNAVLLSVVYLLVVVPVGIIRRMRKKDLTVFDARATSNFKTRDHLFVKEDFENTW